MDPLAVVLPQFALDEALAENDARRDGDHANGDHVAGTEGSGEAEDEPKGAAE